MKKILASLLLLASAAAAALAQPRVVTLDECRQLAVDNNAQVRIARGDAQAAQAVKDEAFTHYFPTVQAQALAFRSNKPVLHYEVGGLFALEMINKGATASITAVQPLFAGGRIANSNKLASVGARAAQLQMQDAIDQAALTAEQYYWQVVTLKAKKGTLAALIVTLDSLHSQVQAMVNAGVANRNDALKVQLQLNSMQATMVDLDNGISLATRLLAHQIGLEGQEIDVDCDAIPQQLPPFPADAYVEAGSALPNTVDYRLLQAQAEAADLERSIAIGQYLPEIAIGGGYFYDDLLNQDYGFAAGFITVSVPLSGWWGGSHSIKQKKIAAANAREKMTDLGEMLEIGMQDQWNNLTSAYRKMEIATESIAQAKENLRLSRNYYDAGISTITDLLEAQTLYRQACDQYTEAYGAYRVAYASYLDATGRSAL